MKQPVAVIGIGNTLMGDDGFGVQVAEKLHELLPDVPVTTGHMAGLGLMRDVLSADKVIFIDALAADGEPGTMYRMDPDEAGITKLRSTTSHGMGIPYLITNARLTGHFPEFVVYAVQIGDIMCGPDTLTPEVERAVPEVVSMIAEEIKETLAASRAG